MLQCVQTATVKGAIVIVITKADDSPLNQIADYLLFVASNEFSFRSGVMSSRLA